MDDLISKYYREDLTEADDQALSERLLNSPEDSLAFAATAEGAYRRYGLPEPQWPGNPDAPLRPRSKVKNWIWFGLLLAGPVGAAFWLYQAGVYPGAFLSGKTGLFSLTGLADRSIDAGPQSLSPAAARPKIKMIPSNLKITFLSTPAEMTQGTSGGGALHESSLGKVAFSTGTPSTTPIDIGTQPSRAHSDLEVVIRWPQAGQVTVRVLSLDGTKEVLLYQGLLQKGKWAFDWDGRLTDGLTAPPGPYQILVESGPVTQSKNIVIR